jgi:hypothetical protein
MTPPFQLTPEEHAVLNWLAQEAKGIGALYLVPAEEICADTGLTKEKFEKAVSFLVGVKFVGQDGDARRVEGPWALWLTAEGEIFRRQTTA